VKFKTYFLNCLLPKKSKSNENRVSFDNFYHEQQFMSIPEIALPQAEFTHPVSACVFHIALQFFITYFGFAQSR